MTQFTINVNSKNFQIEVDEGTPLLWVLREHLGLTGTKYGCGISQCGSCIIHVNNAPLKACTVAIDSVSDGHKITTIEGLSEDGDHPIQKAWIEAQAPQCGYCQSGQIMQALALLNENPNPTREEIKTYMNGVLCRCGTYMRIVKAIEIASSDLLTMK